MERNQKWLEPLPVAQFIDLFHVKVFNIKSLPSSYILCKISWPKFFLTGVL